MCLCTVIVHEFRDRSDSCKDLGRVSSGFYRGTSGLLQLEEAGVAVEKHDVTGSSEPQPWGGHPEAKDRNALLRKDYEILCIER